MSRKITIFFLLAVGILFTGCSTKAFTKPKPKVVTQTKIIYIKERKKNPIEKELDTKKRELAFLNSTPIKDFVVVGEGIAPKNTISPAQALALAKRAAVADAYRQLGEKLYGVKVNAKETVKDAMLNNSKIVTQINGLIKDAYIVESSYKDGLYRVKMELKIDSETWKKIFSY